MKILKKASIMTSKKNIEHMQTERDAPFLVKLHYAFTTGDRLHLVTGEYIKLYSHRN
jgi:hypothetical protein